MKRGRLLRDLVRSRGVARPPPHGIEADPFGEDFFRRLLTVRARLAASLGAGAGASPGGGTAPRGVEFHEHRGYAPGDDPRSVDWNALARLGRPFVKVFRNEERGVLGLVLDASASMAFGSPPKEFLARRIAGALGLAALAGDCRVVAAVGGVSVERRTFAGRGSARDLLRALSAPAGGGSEAVADAIGRLEAGSGATIVLVSDFLDAPRIFQAVAALPARGRALALVQILAREETEPPPLGRARLVDAETGEVLEGTVDERAARASAERARRLEEEVASFAARRGMPSVLARSDRPFEEAALETLERLEALR